MEHLINNVCISESILGLSFMFVPKLVDNTITTEGYVFENEYYARSFSSESLSMTGVYLANSDQIDIYLDALNTFKLTNKKELV